MEMLAENFEAFAVDLRGQGRSTWTPGRYSLDNMGNDLVRFMDLVITHHFRMNDEETGGLRGALSDVQAKRVRDLVSAAGQRIDYISLPMMGHVMHQQDPAQFVKILTEWALA